MSELDLFGETIAETKKPAKKQAPVVVVNRAPQHDAIAFRPFTIVKTDRNSAMLINSDSAHLFR